jgi:hypothetical protein
MYCNVYARALNAIAKLWVTGNRLILRENAQQHMSLSIKELLSVHQLTALLHAPYSPDLSPCNFFFFP